MRLPIRVRLTAWYVGLLALIIAATATFVVVRLRADRVHDVERSLRSSAGQIALDNADTHQHLVSPHENIHVPQGCRPVNRLPRGTLRDLQLIPYVSQLGME